MRRDSVIAVGLILALIGSFIFISMSGKSLFIGPYGLDLEHYYILESDFNHWMHFSLETGVSDVTLNIIPAGFVTQDRHYHRVIFVVDTAPGAGKEVNVTLSNGSNILTVSLKDAETSGWTETGAFDWDVSDENLILSYTQDAGGGATNGFITIKYHYKETE